MFEFLVSDCQPTKEQRCYIIIAPVPPATNSNGVGPYYVTLLIFWLLIDVCFFLLHVSFIFDCLVIFFIILYYVYDFIIK